MGCVPASSTRYYIKAPVNNYFTRVFLFFHDLANLNLRFDIILHIILLYKAFSPLVNNRSPICNRISPDSQLNTIILSDRQIRNQIIKINRFRQILSVTGVVNSQFNWINVKT